LPMRETIKFESSRLKIKRAYDHIQELEGAFEAFLKSDFCHLAIDHEPDTDTYLVKLVSVGNPPISAVH
jgi:hypothetical protein